MSDAAGSPSGGGSDSVVATLLRLLNSFPAALGPGVTHVDSLAQLSDGLTLFHFLHSLEPNLFDPEPLQRPTAAADADGDEDAAAPGSLDASARESNVQYLIDSLETFFEESMGKNFDLAFLDLRQLCAEPSDSSGDSERQAQLVSLLELVLLCAINSAAKEEVIGAIMNMSDAEQQTLMMLIHNIMARADKEQRGGGSGADSGAPATPSGPTPRTPPRKFSADFLSSSSTLTSPSGSGAGVDTPAAATAAAAVAQAEARSLAAAEAAAARQIAALESDKQSLTKSLDASAREVRDWKRQAHEAQERLVALQESSAASLRAALAQREQEVERATKETSKAEVARLGKEIARGEARVTQLEGAVRSAQEQILALQRELSKAQEVAEERAAELARLTDDLHLAQSKNEQLDSLQTKHEKLRARLGEMDSLRSANQALEAENSKQLDRIIELESAGKEVDSLKVQLNRLRDLSVATDSALLDKTLAEDAARAQLQDLKEELQAAREGVRQVEGELKSTKSERDAALAKLRVLSSNAAAAGAGARGASDGVSGGLGGDLLEEEESASAAEENPRATIRRLELEVARLRNEASAAASESAAAAAAGATPIEVALLRSQKDSLQEKYLEAQRRVAAINAETERAKREAADKAAAAERLLEEERERAREEREALESRLAAASAAAAAAAASNPAQSEEIAALRQEAIELHEQLDAMRAASAAAGGADAAPASPTKAARSVPPSPAASPSASAAAASAAAAAAATASADLAKELETAQLRNKKLETYIKQSQKKMKLLEEEHHKTQQQLQQEHNAYKTALVERERELVEREKSRLQDTAHATRERKLLSSAFYSMGMEFQAALMSGRAIGKNGAAAPAGRSWLSQQRMAAANQ